jgi:hypothetical protein
MNWLERQAEAEKIARESRALRYFLCRLEFGNCTSEEEVLRGARGNRLRNRGQILRQLNIIFE